MVKPSQSRNPFAPRLLTYEQASSFVDITFDLCGEPDDLILADPWSATWKAGDGYVTMMIDRDSQGVTVVVFDGVAERVFEGGRMRWDSLWRLWFHYSRLLVASGAEVNVERGRKLAISFV